MVVLESSFSFHFGQEKVKRKKPCSQKPLLIPYGRVENINHSHNHARFSSLIILLLLPTLKRTPSTLIMSKPKRNNNNNKIKNHIFAPLNLSLPLSFFKFIERGSHSLSLWSHFFFFFSKKKPSS